MSIQLSKEQQKTLNEYPKVTLTQEQLNELPEYSTTDPTQDGELGVKVFKRRTPFNASYDEAIWFVGTVKGPEITFKHVVIA